MWRLTLEPTPTLYIVFSRGRTVKLKLPPSPVFVDCTDSETGYGYSEASRRTVTGPLPGRTAPLSVSGWPKTTRRVSGPRSATSTDGGRGCVAVGTVAARLSEGVAPPQPTAIAHTEAVSTRLIGQR